LLLHLFLPAPTIISSLCPRHCPLFSHSINIDAVQPICYALLLCLLPEGSVRHIEYFTTQSFETQFITALAVCLKSYLEEKNPKTKAQ